jgi:rhodanese-related sulfurtransferase
MDGEFKSYLFIDVRGHDEYAQAHVPGAINITVGEITEDHPRLKELDKNTEIVVYCAAGGRAEQAKKKLEALGFNKVINGINKLEVEKNYLS